MYNFMLKDLFFSFLCQSISVFSSSSNLRPSAHKNNFSSRHY